MVDVAQLMDELGYYCLWTAEHHFQREGYEVFPNLILLWTWLATQTQRLKLGCAFNVLPMWHPIRLAEDYAMADILTGGRVIMGVGRGYHTREVETFGAPLLDEAANRELFEEQMELMLKVFNEESFSHQGKHYTVPARRAVSRVHAQGGHLVPRPDAPPGRDLAADRQRQVDRRTWRRHGIKGMVTLNGERIPTRSSRPTATPARATAGRKLRWARTSAWGVGLYWRTAEEEAIRRVEPSHDERYKWFAPFGFVRYADEQGRPWGTPGRARAGPDDPRRRRAEGLDGRLARGLHRAASASTRRSTPGWTSIMLHWPEGIPAAEFMEQLRWFARDVMPAFRDR